MSIRIEDDDDPRDPPDDGTGVREFLDEPVEPIGFEGEEEEATEVGDADAETTGGEGEIHVDEEGRNYKYDKRGHKH